MDFYVVFNIFFKHSISAKTWITLQKNCNELEVNMLDMIIVILCVPKKENVNKTLLSFKKSKSEIIKVNLKLCLKDLRRKKDDVRRQSLPVDAMFHLLVFRLSSWTIWRDLKMLEKHNVIHFVCLFCSITIGWLLY